MDLHFHPKGHLLASSTSSAQISACQYAIENWATHVCNAGILPVDLCDAIINFCERNFVQWFQIQLQSDDKGSRVVVSNHSNRFGTGYQTLKDIHRIDEIISTQVSVVRLVANDHPKRANHLDNLGNLYTSRYSLTGQLSDLDRAIDIHRNALLLRAIPGTDRSTSLSNLASALWTRFHRTSQLCDLEETIMHDRESTRLLTNENPLLCTMSTNLGCALMNMFFQNQKSGYLDDAMTIFRAAVNNQLAPVSQRLRAAWLWYHYADHGNHDSALEAYQIVIEILPQLAPFMRNITQSTVEGWSNAVETEGYVDRDGE
jgi:tetratricopeptide (TPR) repeat protein